ncbi:M61 family metallopeptidase [Waterburya agarophytonicola K14]|uniref:M61 family metallopeptidase n=1 Tax=Waterburya agarophytonicola KI4 TaxID=2874699 RepID=A0A964BUF8_9CYAN|nr:M61 family metallopeptidase [Waterburya agarophytonicola]MCC0178411.1 M61 family metallopeptidase [Waterburya agarophytonicola KI4]
MTEATAIRQPQPTHKSATLYYQVAMPQPASHLFEVTLEVNDWQSEVLNLKMPVWTPGSYLVREYARHIQDFTARDSKGKILASQKLSKNHWQVATESNSQLKISYRLYANDLTVRTNHLDGTHGYFNGAAIFFFIPNLEQEPIKLKVIPPQADWQVSTTLPALAGEENVFMAPDFDTLVDTPVEIGTQQIYDFEVLGKPHSWVVWSQGNFQPEQAIKDTTKIIEVEAKMFGGLPYEQYLFLLHLSGSGYGGLEHKDSCTLNYPRFGFRDREKYQRFLQLVAHEFFHLWNVKRLRPQALAKFDYERENYTTSLWFCEGTTSYYDILIPLRAGIYNRKTYLKSLSKDVNRYLNIPGRNVQPLGESSYDAWIKLYRRDAYSDNNQISYYLKGQLVSLLLDLLIRAKHNNTRSLDDVMALMWQRFGRDEIGFSETQLRDTIAEVAEDNLDDFFHRYIETTEELPFNDYLDPFGLHLKTVEESDIPYLGIRLQSENNQEIIEFVAAQSPAASAGIDAKDELLAINGIRVDAQSLNDRLKDYQVNDTIQVTVFHQDELKTLAVTLAKSPPSSYKIAIQDNLSDQQKQNLTGWLGN